MPMPHLLVLILALLTPPALVADATDLIRDGEAKLQAGELDAAVAVLQEAVAVDANSALARLRLGGALLMKQEYRGAIEQFRETLRLDPASANAFVGMSVAYLHGARYDLARAALEEAIRIDPAKREEAAPLFDYIDRAIARSEGATADVANPHPIPAAPEAAATPEQAPSSAAD